MKKYDVAAYVWPAYTGDELCFDATPENIETGFRLAKDYVDAHPDMKAPLIVVNSWNEWTEGSYLQPDDLNGYGFLEAAKRVFVDEEL